MWDRAILCITQAVSCVYEGGPETGLPGAAASWFCTSGQVTLSMCGSVFSL